MSESTVPVLVPTDQGAEMVLRSMTGEKLYITKLVMGDGQLSNVGSIPGLTSLIHERVRTAMVSTTRKGRQLTVLGTVTLAADTQPFRWRELGVLAHIGTETDKLLGYLNKAESGEMVSPADGVERSIYVTIEIDPAANVEVVLGPRERVDWEQLDNVPEDFPPEEHDHVVADITDFPDTMPPSPHTHTAAQITGLPSTMPPDPHTHTRSQIIDFPTTMPPTGHTHSAGDINSGTLGSDRLPVVPITKGGHGATTKEGGRKALGAVKAFSPTGVILYASGWSGSGPWTQSVTVAGVTAADQHLQVYPIDIADAAARKLYRKAYACLAPTAETGAGKLTFTCRDDKPTTNFQVMVKGVQD